LQYATQDFRCDEEIARIAVKQNPSAAQFVDETLLKNVEFARRIVKEGTPRYLEFVSFLEVLSSQSLASDVAAISPMHICCFSPQVTDDAAFMATLLLKHGTKVIERVPAQHRTSAIEVALRETAAHIGTLTQPCDASSLRLTELYESLGGDRATHRKKGLDLLPDMLQKEVMTRHKVSEASYELDVITANVKHGKATKDSLVDVKKKFDSIEEELTSLVELVSLYESVCPEMVLWRRTADKNLKDHLTSEAQKQEAAKNPFLPAHFFRPHTEELLCVICHEAPKTHVFDPCGHKCCCSKCAQEVMKKSKVCCMCRTPIKSVIQVFE